MWPLRQNEQTNISWFRDFPSEAIAWALGVQLTFSWKKKIGKSNEK